MKIWSITLLVFVLAACRSAIVNESSQTETTPIAPELPDLGEAPELTNQIWLNTDQPLRLADLRGQVVLLDMWTFG